MDEIFPDKKYSELEDCLPVFNLRVESLPRANMGRDIGKFDYGMNSALVCCFYLR